MEDLPTTDSRLNSVSAVVADFTGSSELALALHLHEAYFVSTVDAGILKSHCHTWMWPYILTFLHPNSLNRNSHSSCHSIPTDSEWTYTSIFCFLMVLLREHMQLHQNSSAWGKFQWNHWCWSFKFTLSFTYVACLLTFLFHTLNRKQYSSCFSSTLFMCGPTPVQVLASSLWPSTCMRHICFNCGCWHFKVTLSYVNVALYTFVLTPPFIEQEQL